MDIILFLLSCLICYMISSAIHELGHIITGLFQNFKFYLFVVGPLGIRRDSDDKIKIYFEKNLSLWGGIGATVPQNDHKNNFKRFGRVLLGGPITSIIMGILFLPIGIFTDSTFLLLIGAMTFGMGIACLIPARNGAFYTDGGRWLRMHKNEETRNVEMAIWNLTQNLIIYNGYAQLDLIEILVLVENHDIRTRYLGHYYAYHYYLTLQDIENATVHKKLIEELKSKVPKQMVNLFQLNQSAIENSTV